MKEKPYNTPHAVRPVTGHRRGRSDQGIDPREGAERAAALLAAGGLLRVPDVLALVNVSASTWFAGVKARRYPAGVKLSPRCTAWRAADIAALLDSFGSEVQP